MGLSVLKGEKGIKIFVPVDMKQFKTKQGTWKNLSYATKEEKDYLAKQKNKVETRKRLGFKLGTVFDVTQTNVKPEDYPNLFPNRKKKFQYAGKDLTILNKNLLHYANQQNISVQTAKITNSAAKGYYRPDTYASVLSDRNNESENTHTLIHELAHAVLHNQQKMAEKDAALQGTPVVEYQAEMTAYIVAHHFGLDTESHSLQYTAQWTKNLNEVAPLTKALEEIRRASSDLIEALETILENELGNVQENKEIAQESKNDVLSSNLYSIKTIEPIATIGSYTVCDVELHSETTESQFYRILTNKTPVAIGRTWDGEKSGAEWLKENSLTGFIEKYPEITSPQEKIATLEKSIAGEAQSLSSYINQKRVKNVHDGLSR